MIFFTQDITLPQKKRQRPIIYAPGAARRVPPPIRNVIMRLQLIIVFLTLCLAQVFANVYGQITIKKVNAELAEVLQDIERQSGYVFIYDASIVHKQSISIHVDDKNLYETLEICLRGLPIQYHVVDKNVVLKHRPREVYKDTGHDSKIAMDFVEVRGQVTDSLGSPVVGASVHAYLLMDGRRVALRLSEVTDRSGFFTLSNVPKDAILLITHIGYVSREIKAASNVGRVIIKATHSEIEDVLVTGLRDLRRETYTGNAVTVTQEQIEKVGQRNIADILQVFDPSFRIEVNNIMGSDPNTLPEFYIRGRSGIGVKELDELDVSEAALTNNPNLPIFIMDGYEVSPERVYDFDITRIESIAILKDAAATAVYGSRAANGVVVITTVPPQSGKLNIDYNVVTSLTLPDLSDYNLMNAEEKLKAEILMGHYDLEKESNLGVRARLLDELLMKQNQLTRGVNTDWIAQPLRNGLNQKHTVSIDGGSGDVRFNLLVNYDNENGVMKKSKRSRQGVGLTVEYKLNRFQVRNRFSYDIVNAVNSPYGAFSEYTWKAPYDEMLNEKGEPLPYTNLWHTGSEVLLNRANPFYEVFVTNNFDKSGYHHVSNNTTAIWRIGGGFELRADLALTQQTNTADRFVDPSSGRYVVTETTELSMLGELSKRFSKSYSFNSNMFLRYDRRIGNHNMNFSGGFNVREAISEGHIQNYRGFPSGKQHSPNYASSMASSPRYNDNHTRLLGAFMALNYSFRDIYLLDMSGRLDGSSEFGADKRFAPFWSFGTGINLHNQDWLVNNEYVTRFRVAASMGQLGKTNFPPYAVRGMYEAQPDWYRTGTGVQLLAMESRELTWEKTNTFDAVLDLGLFQNRLNLNLNWYNKLTHDLVNDVDLPLSSGFSSYKANVGKVKNEGFEVFLRFDVVRRTDFLVGVYGNFASNRNTLLELSNSLKRYNELVDARYSGYNPASVYNLERHERYSRPLTKYVEGGSLTSIFGMKSLGINPMDGREIYRRPDGSITYDWSAMDQQIIGDRAPKGQGSFGLNTNFRGWSLFASFLYQYGGQEYNSTLVNKVENVDLYNRNADRRVLTMRWQNPGDLAPLKDIASRRQTTRPTSRFIQNYDMIKFNSLSLSYDVDRSFLNQYGLSRVRIQLSSINLGVISTVFQERGLNYPFARTYDFALKVVL